MHSILTQAKFKISGALTLIPTISALTEFYSMMAKVISEKLTMTKACLSQCHVRRKLTIRLFFMRLEILGSMPPR